MTFHIITLFPRAFDSYLGESILKRAIEDKKIKVKFYNPRDFTKDKHKRIDRAPYGGGPGMVIQAEPVIKALEKALRDLGFKVYDLRKKKLNAKRLTLNASPRIVWLNPHGKQFTNGKGIQLARHKHLIIICGRYEGIDARVKQAIHAMGAALEEISVGPFVLTGGELPAMLMIDVISRQVPGVLGDFNSREEARVASPDVYTRPEVFDYKGKKFRVPAILLSGHHAKIEAWRQARRKK
ncbi:MAG: tRNA (guanosine(37)-N1)-methyltransferase TrmD [Candidatus Taylorbacteria bacterium RIFCSPHIGHO2_02_49_25]|uniref:tRNA (guanine-N(1)-)-methyltransferase n=1 Tax=Candidatus Taylorbacteria bacterium RIFCSPHIGHO2_02_49_25 TaxID=1802305 RepID=A0A1G2MCZ8_9BACT|nr:MAG: tRNA (guanine-N(1)-)-methyltransferase [Parcubacteria group bacterium GW2011_GWF2_50_9]OHA19524.1 MAG: tRNA (guanosine(37)-N1)-methyltransferase TrmD [Candidatus Taylorbacteria bacterium RIFCSPHIGHO2_01_FULL_49_60]OHA20891.1 MAG: tRNA (guanosine(37)-N1)-methyltransferase TrmD [Candidatus Taylorbacteria bacterium RIFCSPHIGHO2_02_49_25]OHA37375.1 MAG: tRNA (guanosine(37)-N1)-methyltransferase TrmD [Candidatus Taylorbacteria bacterium RIFCSPLOWO2_02_50_13]OHA48025.1 MAG: tRNA (guanosine(37